MSGSQLARDGKSLLPIVIAQQVHLGDRIAARISQIAELDPASSNAVSGIRWAAITKLVGVQVHRMFAVVFAFRFGFVKESAQAPRSSHRLPGIWIL